MNRISCGAVVVAVAAAAMWYQPAVTAESPSIAHGKYIVEDVAMCPRCHSPVSAQGEVPRPLSGGPIPIRPVTPTDNWAEESPRLAGSPPGTDEQIIRLLMTGVDRHGHRPRPPMPQFRMTHTDAASVVAYLRSLGSAN